MIDSDEIPLQITDKYGCSYKIRQKKKSTKFLKDNHKAAINPERPVGGAKNINANVL